MNEHELEFVKFLESIETMELDTNTTATGLKTIQQSKRNELRKLGVTALKHDLERIYGDQFDIVETKEGIVIIAENEPGDFTFSWELKNTIKSLDYDPFIEANNYEEGLAEKQAKKERQAKEKADQLNKVEGY